MAEELHNGEERELDLSDDKVVTKYKASAEICNSACPGLRGQQLIPVAAWCRSCWLSRLAFRLLGSTVSCSAIPAAIAHVPGASGCASQDAQHAAAAFRVPRAAEALAAVVEATKDGAKVVDLCRIGDDVITK
jgi:hypothetical protein